MSDKFYVKDCPDYFTVHRWIMEETDIGYYVKNMKPENGSLLNEFRDTSISVSRLKETNDSAFKTFGWHGFFNIYNTMFDENATYGGASITYNPSYRYEQIEPIRHTLGYPRANVPDELLFKNFSVYERVMEMSLDKEIWTIFQEKGTHAAFLFLKDRHVISDDFYNSLIQTYANRVGNGSVIVKDCYQDTWGFNKFTEIASHGEFSNITSRLKRTPVRSRLAEIRNITTEKRFENINKYAWHRDESWFYELRMNLSITNPDNNCGIEIDGIGKKCFTEGHWYVWDTDELHRPYLETFKPNETRSNYVLAVNPWFDWVEEDQCWIKNEFYGNKHPLDMVIDGDVLDGLEQL